jgi:hypothetical protein
MVDVLHIHVGNRLMKLLVNALNGAGTRSKGAKGGGDLTNVQWRFLKLSQGNSLVKWIYPNKKRTYFNRNYHDRILTASLLPTTWGSTPQWIMWVLFSWGCHNNVPYTWWQNQQKLILKELLVIEYWN